MWRTKALALSAVGALTFAAAGAGRAETPNPYLKSDGSGDVEIGRLLSFGDSYSALRRKTRFTNWVEQLRTRARRWRSTATA